MSEKNHILDSIKYNSHNSIFGTIINLSPNSVQLLLDNGYRTNIMFRSYNILNMDEIDFNDGEKRQKFVLSDFQMENLFIYKGRKPPVHKIKKMMRDFKKSIRYKHHRLALDIADAYRYASNVYKKSILNEDHEDSSEIGGIGDAKIVGLKRNRNITKILMDWLKKNPSFGRMKSDHSGIHFALTLNFSVEIYENHWRLYAWKPKMDAMKEFLNYLVSCGYDFKGLRIVKTR